MQQWYEQHFQEDYVKIYAHRNDESAAAKLEKIDKLIGFEPGKKLLDLCCGEGRHSRWFAKKGLQVVGVDLSQTLLRIAKSKSCFSLLQERSIPKDEKHGERNKKTGTIKNQPIMVGWFSVMLFSTLPSFLS